jgi:hypothetical protein
MFNTVESRSRSLQRRSVPQRARLSVNGSRSRSKPIWSLKSLRSESAPGTGVSRAERVFDRREIDRRLLLNDSGANLLPDFVKHRREQLLPARKLENHCYAFVFVGNAISSRESNGLWALSLLERVGPAFQFGDAKALENSKRHGTQPLSRRFEMLLPSLEPLNLRLRQRHHAPAIQNELGHLVSLFQRTFKIRGQLIANSYVPT